MGGWLGWEHPEKQGPPPGAEGKGGSPHQGPRFWDVEGTKVDAFHLPAWDVGGRTPSPERTPPWGVWGDQGVHPPSLGAVEGVEGLLPSSSRIRGGSRVGASSPQKGSPGFGGDQGVHP